MRIIHKLFIIIISNVIFSASIDLDKATIVTNNIIKERFPKLHLDEFTISHMETINSDNIDRLRDCDSFINLSELGTDIRLGLRTDWKWINLHMGASAHEKRNSKAMGFSFNFQKWFISYGIYYHENSILAPSLPQFIDIRFYF